MDYITNFFRGILSNLGGFLWGIALILIAWVLATLLRNLFSKGLKKTALPNKLAQWNVVRTPQDGANLIDTLSKVIYYLVWVLFLPAIFEQFGLTSLAQPFSNMINNAVTFIPNLLAAILILFLGVVVARFVKNLVYNLALSINVDRIAGKFMDHTPQDGEERKASLAKVLGTIAFVLVLIPFAIIALETLKIASITAPIIAVLTSILNAIPNILVAAILLAVGIVIAKFVEKLLQDILENTGINKLTSHVDDNRVQKVNLAKIISKVVGVVIILFFLVEALTALNLPVFNAIGVAIIAYLPNVISALIILGLGLIGGRMLARFIADNFGSKLVAYVVQVALAVFAVFMALNQLNFANAIVNIAFILIIGALAVAFAIAFGIGGRDFAKRRLEELESTIDEEGKKVGAAVKEYEEKKEARTHNVEFTEPSHKPASDRGGDDRVN